MNKKTKSILALLVTVLPMSFYMIWFRLHQTENFTIFDMLFYPLIIGGGMSLFIIWLNKSFLRSNFKKTFNPAREPVSSDVVMGIILAIIYFVMLAIERQTIYQWFPQTNPASREVMGAFEKIAYNPLLLTLWLGPVLWIGVAFFEEISRVFMLKCLWNLSNSKSWQIIVVFLVSLLIGLTHLHQGTAGILSVGLQSLLMGLYFYKFKRILPLILSHGLYDGIQIIGMVMQFR